MEIQNTPKFILRISHNTIELTICQKSLLRAWLKLSVIVRTMKITKRFKFLRNEHFVINFLRSSKIWMTANHKTITHFRRTLQIEVTRQDKTTFLSQLLQLSLSCRRQSVNLNLRNFHVLALPAAWVIPRERSEVAARLPRTGSEAVEVGSVFICLNAVTFMQINFSD